MKWGHFLVFVAGFSMVPLLAFAQVTIIEIMYDPAGADSGHEWIKVQNTGISSIRFSDLRLRTAGVNHKITALSGDGALGAGEYAAIVQDSTFFSQDNTAFAGPVFRASFSLTNKSGVVEIVDKTGVVVASRSYQAPPPAPKPAKQKTTQAKKSPKQAQAQEAFDVSTPESASPGSNSIEKDEYYPMVAAGASAHPSVKMWWMGTIALAGVASVATFASRHVAKREWDIIEEKETD
jgi:hypothetical protein